MLSQVTTVLSTHYTNPHFPKVDVSGLNNCQSSMCLLMGGWQMDCDGWAIHTFDIQSALFQGRSGASMVTETNTHLVTAIKELHW
jgi:hypothetical protein